MVTTINKETLNTLTLAIDKIVTNSLENNTKPFLHINPITGEIVTYFSKITPYLGFIELIIDWDVVKHYYLLPEKWKLSFYKNTLKRILSNYIFTIGSTKFLANKRP